MASEEKSQVKKRSREKEGKIKKKRSRKQKKKKKQKISLSKCVPGCLAKVADYIGIKTISEKMKKINDRNYNFEQVVTTFTKDSDFQSHKVLCSTFDPLLVDPEHIFLVQICSVHVDNHSLRDNFHSVTLFDNKIFDLNIEQPLPLTKDNLDRCCLGDEWVYDHCSRVKRFSINWTQQEILIFTLFTFYCSFFLV